MFNGIPPEAVADATHAVEFLGLKPQLTWSALVESVEGQLRKPLQIVQADESEWANAPITGLLVETAEHAVIICRASDPPLYQRHSVLHEFGHIMIDAIDCHALELLPTSLVESVGIGDAILRSASRGLDVGREELAAEAVAYLLAGRLLQPGVSAHGSAFGL
jgi:hypothetical protein